MQLQKISKILHYDFIVILLKVKSKKEKVNRIKRPAIVKQHILSRTPKEMSLPPTWGNNAALCTVDAERVRVALTLSIPSAA